MITSCWLPHSFSSLCHICCRFEILTAVSIKATFSGMKVFYLAVLFGRFILLFYLAVLFCCFIWLFYLAVLFGCLILFFLKVDTVFQTTRRHTSEISYFPSQPSTYPYQPKGNVLEANCNVKNLLSCIQRRKKSLFANIRL